ncbi:MAG: GNAT family N-acetyltransferase, partial [candidate division Zixibacteria bacterium]
VGSEARIVDISPDDWQPTDDSLVRAIRKAEREGVQVIPFSRKEHYASFIELTEHAKPGQKRDSMYSHSFFERLAILSETEDRIRWYAAIDDGRLVASHIYLVDKNKLTYWQAFSKREDSSLKANQFLMYKAVCQDSRDGIKLLNLGQTPTGADSLADYKRRWGGSMHRYRCLQKQTMLGRIL